MPCDECKKLHDAETNALRSLQEQHYINSQWRINSRKSAKEEIKRLERAYTLACAESRLHKGKCHPEEGYKVTIEDIHIKLREGRTSP
jgi:hypothetical protein